MGRCAGRVPRHGGELHREAFAIDDNQVVQAGVSAIGTTLKLELGIQAVQVIELP
ncbi:hypothetical protein GCM10010381_33610 [Streptomyces xantholiticus]|nr:hypothetical protein GCM10010381_33610 [Streptomyces xantholiticus]